MDMNDEMVDNLAMSILAKHGAECTVTELKEYIDDSNAVLKLRYCLQAVKAALRISNDVKWAKISDNGFPKNKWVLILTADMAHHVAYHNGTKWIANSKFGAEPLWWMIPSLPMDLNTQP